RYALNFKGLQYKTQWVEYCDIEQVSKALGAKPTDIKARKPLYTLPMIYDDSTGAMVTDSIAIAEYLDITYPEKSLLMPAGAYNLHMALI
ncbi:hypothetical protein C8J56DRAFT_757479, partial [Mycena floridula]